MCNEVPPACSLLFLLFMYARPEAAALTTSTFTVPAAVSPNGPVYLPHLSALFFSDTGNASVSFYVLDVVRGNSTAVWTGHSFGGMQAHDPYCNQSTDT